MSYLALICACLVLCSLYLLAASFATAWCSILFFSFNSWSSFNSIELTGSINKTSITKWGKNSCASIVLFGCVIVYFERFESLIANGWSDTALAFPCATSSIPFFINQSSQAVARLFSPVPKPDTVVALDSSFTLRPCAAVPLVLHTYEHSGS